MLWAIRLEEYKREQAPISQAYLDLEGSKEKNASIFLVWLFPVQDVQEEKTFRKRAKNGDTCIRKDLR